MMPLCRSSPSQPKGTNPFWPVPESNVAVAAESRCSQAEMMVSVL